MRGSPSAEVLAILEGDCLCTIGRGTCEYHGAQPSHIIAEPGDKRALCGVKNPLPVVAAKAVEMHVAGYGMVVCPDCDRLRVKP